MDALSQSQQQIITELMNGVIHHSEPINKLIQKSFDTATSLAVNGIIAGGAQTLLAKGAVVATTKAGFVLTSTMAAATTAIIVTTAVMVGVSIYYAYNIYKDQQKWYREISHETSMAMEHIGNCFKEECEERKDDFFVNRPKFRDHPALMSYINLQNMTILKDEEKNIDYENKKKEYKEKIEKYIKPEKLQDFEKEMRLYCAGNKILSDANYHEGHYKTAHIDYAGEFRNSKPRRHSVAWEMRESQKQKMGGMDAIDWTFKIKQNVLGWIGLASHPVTMFNDGYTFKQVRDKFYGMYKALTFALYTNFNNDKLENDIVTPYNEFLKLAIKPECMDQFKKEFRQYRYEGGSCEFDGEEIFKMKLFNNYYSELSQSTQKNFTNSDNSSNWRYQIKRQAIIAGVTGGITLLVGSLQGIIQYENYMNVVRAEQIDKLAVDTGNFTDASLKCQLENNVVGAQLKLDQIKELTSRIEINHYDTIGDGFPIGDYTDITNCNQQSHWLCDAVINRPKSMIFETIENLKKIPSGIEISEAWTNELMRIL